VKSSLVPEADSEDETRNFRIASFLVGKGRGLARVAGVREPDTGHELAAELVPDTKTRIEL